MEEEKNEELDLRFGDLLTVFSRCWWVMLLVVIVVGVGFYSFLKATHVDTYTATTMVYVMDENNINASGVSISNSFVKDVVAIADWEPTLQAVADEYNAQYNPGNGLFEKPETESLTWRKLRGMTKVTQQTDSRYVEVSVTYRYAPDAAVLSHILANQLCKTLRESLGDQEYARVVVKASEPKTPSNPISKLIVLLVAMFCGIIVYVVYLVLFLLDDKINSPEDVEKYLDLNLLGQIPNKQESTKKKKYYSGYYSSEKTHQ